ncbi:MAG: sulfite exporter TauE/SafE family protein [Magnetococcales bacterium]|nr:sulfite exporter TauE/SafE family protein [Magnetococcales bacterium]
MDLLLVYLGAVVQAALGFGFALISAPLLKLIDPGLLPGPLMVAGMLLNMAMGARGLKAAEKTPLGWMVLGSLPGLWLGVLSYDWLNPRQADMLFGFLVLSAVGMSRLHGARHATAGVLVSAGFFSGIMNITTTMGGPPVVLALQALPGDRFRATLAFYFLVIGAISLFILPHSVQLDLEKSIRGLELMPAVILGIWSAGPFERWLDAGRTRVAVLLLAATAGGVLVFRAWPPVDHATMAAVIFAIKNRILDAIIE